MRSGGNTPLVSPSLRRVGPLKMSWIRTRASKIGSGVGRKGEGKSVVTGRIVWRGRLRVNDLFFVQVGFGKY